MFRVFIRYLKKFLRKSKDSESEFPSELLIIFTVNGGQSTAFGKQNPHWAWHKWLYWQMHYPDNYIETGLPI